jgi:hypothetical protein
MATNWVKLASSRARKKAAVGKKSVLVKDCRSFRLERICVRLIRSNVIRWAPSGRAMPLPHQLGQANEVVSRGGQRMAQLRHACGVEMGLRRPGNLYDTCIRSRSNTLNRIGPGAAGFDGSNRMSQKARYVRLWCFWAAGGQLRVGSVGSDRKPATAALGWGAPHVSRSSGGSAGGM